MPALAMALRPSSVGYAIYQSLIIRDKPFRIKLVRGIEALRRVR